MSFRIRRVSDTQVEDEIRALDAYIGSQPDRRLATYALGARQALEWIRGAEMNPARLIELMAFAFDLPRVIPFEPKGQRDVAD